MRRKGLALSRRLASCLLAATLAAGLAAPQAAVYAGEPDAVLEEEKIPLWICILMRRKIPIPNRILIHMSMLLRILTLRKMQRMQMRR